MKTILYDNHIALRGKIVEFCGWQMPLHYGSALEEHLHVRSSAGLFDVSHMGFLTIQGSDAQPFVSWLVTNEVVSKNHGSAIYTLLCNESGSCIDDVILLKQNDDTYSMIVNAGNRAKVYEYLNAMAKDRNVVVRPHYEGFGMLALQGPASLDVFKPFFSLIETIKPMHFVQMEFEGVPLLLSRTGYTGEVGIELIAPNHSIITFWQKLLCDKRVKPCGLAARDTLRLEAGFALYGHELTEKINGAESLSAWTIHWQKPHFSGKQALLECKQSPTRRHSCGMILESRAIPRGGETLFLNEEEIGIITSGGFSPSLQKPIALALITKELYAGDEVQLLIRGQRHLAKVVNLPFVAKKKNPEKKV